MKTSVTLFLVIIFYFTLTVAYADPKVIIIGGWNSDMKQYEILQKSIPGSIVVIPQISWPLYDAAPTVLQQIKKKSTAEQLTLIGHSWGGLIARKIDADNPGLVQKIITIGSPSGGFGPAFIRYFFDTSDKESLTPLYVIVGYNNSTPKWYMDANGKNDGVIDLKSALDFRGKNVVDQNIKIIEGLKHTEMLKSQKVIQIVKEWVK